MIRFTEHLLTNIISSIIQITFGPHQLATDDLRKSQKFYELILVDSQSISIRHTFDKHHPTQILYSKCIIRDVITSQQWKNPFEECKFSIAYNPQTYNYNDYKNAWYRAFLLHANIHSWFFNFHEQCFKHISRMILPLVDNVWMFDNSTPLRSKGRLGLLVTSQYKHGPLYKVCTIFQTV